MTWECLICGAKWPAGKACFAKCPGCGRLTNNKTSGLINTLLRKYFRRIDYEFKKGLQTNNDRRT